MLVRCLKSTAKYANPHNVFLVVEKIVKNVKYVKKLVVKIVQKKTAAESAIETK